MSGQTEITQQNMRPNVPQGYMINAQGHLVPESMVPDIDKARDDLVREIVGDAESLREQMTEFKQRAMSDLSAFVDLSAEKYGAKMGGTKGNITFMSFDGQYKIQVAVGDRIVFDERLQIAKKLVDECIVRWAEGSNSHIRALVQHAFQTDKEGKISVGRVLGLMRLEIDDDQWVSAMKAAQDSMQFAGTSTYMRIYRRIGDSDKYEHVTMDFARL